MIYVRVKDGKIFERMDWGSTSPPVLSAPKAQWVPYIVEADPACDPAVQRIATNEVIASDRVTLRKTVEPIPAKEQIAALEARQTPRRLREAVLGKDNGWLAGLENQISALRK